MNVSGSTTVVVRPILSIAVVVRLCVWDGSDRGSGRVDKIVYDDGSLFVRSSKVVETDYDMRLNEAPWSMQGFYTAFRLGYL
jgi:hypothetical protein